MPVLETETKLEIKINDELFTINKYKIGNKYLDERLEKHEDIIYVKISNATPDEEPSAVLLGGGSGAGKSTIIKQYFDIGVDKLEESSDFVYIDSDEIKKHLDEFTAYQESDDEEIVLMAAFYVHRESTDIADKLIEECIKRKLSFIYDGTMQWKPQYDVLIPQLKSNDYEVTGVYVDVALEKANERAKKRGKEEKRFVPLDVVKKANINSAINFSKLESSFDGVMMFNNTADRKITASTEVIPPFYTREQGAQGEIHIKEFYNLFIEKSNMGYIK